MVGITKHYLISGRVQGVGYRAFTRARAAELGLKGWVRNLADGRVEAVANGTVPELQSLEAELKSGPAHGQVDSLQVAEWPTAGEPLPAFEVRKDGLKPCTQK